MKTQQLSEREREFCIRAAEAVAANPFSDTYRDLNRGLAGQQQGKFTVATVSKVADRLKHFVDNLGTQGRLSLEAYSGDDHTILEKVVTFDLFHRLLPQFDNLVSRQIESGDSPITVPFASDALQLFRRTGMSEKKALHYFALCFQLRRAFYFIDRALKGNAPCMRTLREHLWNSVFTCDLNRYSNYLVGRMEDFSTLIIGETGTGKGSAASAIGRSMYIPFDEKKGTFRDSFNTAFTEINLAQYPEALIESELFGHRKGAFTGAAESHNGILSRCVGHGTVFLDEIGDVSVPVQIKLLRVLQERSYSPVGSHEVRQFRGRVIAATNRDIGNLRRCGLFRNDFFYRLSSNIIEMPALATRLDENPDELPLLVHHVVQKIIGADPGGLVDEIVRIITRTPGRNYQWPGNIRELEQCVRRILLNGNYCGDPDAQPLAEEGRSIQTLIDEGTAGASVVLSQYCRTLFRRFGTFEKVAAITRLDRRTVKKYIEQSPA